MLQHTTRVRSVIAVMVCTALLFSCRATSDNDDTPVAEAYILVVDWVLAEPAFAVEAEDDELPVVYVESLGPAEIELDVQVEVIGHFEDEADIRFIDSRAEALAEDGEGPVRDGGLLVGLGGMRLDGSWDVRGEIYQTADSVVGYRFRIDRSNQTLVMTQTPEPVEPEGLVADS